MPVRYSNVSLYILPITKIKLGSCFRPSNKITEPFPK